MEKSFVKLIGSEKPAKSLKGAKIQILFGPLAPSWELHEKIYKSFESKYFTLPYPRFYIKVFLVFFYCV